MWRAEQHLQPYDTRAPHVVRPGSFRLQPWSRHHSKQVYFTWTHAMVCHYSHGAGTLTEAQEAAIHCANRTQHCRAECAHGGCRARRSRRWPPAAHNPGSADLPMGRRCRTVAPWSVRQRLTRSRSGAGAAGRAGLQEAAQLLCQGIGGQPGLDLGQFVAADPSFLSSF